MSEVSKSTLLPPGEPQDIRARHTQYFFIGFYLLAVVWGIRGIYQTEASALDLLVPFALAVCLGWWALVDARHRRTPIPGSAKPWVFFLAGIVVPGYVVWSRGWRGLGWLVVHAFLWVALAAIAMHMGGMFVYGEEEWLRALGI